MKLSEFERKRREVFLRQRMNSRRRGIPWALSYEDWCDIWEKSGKYEERGNKATSYCMSRINDEGPYVKGNVQIKTLRANSQEYSNRHWSRTPLVDPWETGWNRKSAWEYLHHGVIINRLPIDDTLTDVV